MANYIPNNNGRSSSKDFSPTDYSSYFDIDADLKIKILEKILELKQETITPFYENPNCTIHWIPVDDGQIRVLHILPEAPESIRPIVFLSGWQTMAHQFDDLDMIIHNRVEFYFVETREKNTSKLNRRKADLSISQKAKDVQKVIEYFNLQSEDFVLFGSCWGATIIFQGLLERTLDAPTIVTFSPMHKIWLNKFILKILVPILPPFLFGIVLKSLAPLFFLREKAKTQKNRMMITIKEAENWKWRKCIIAHRNLNLFGKLHDIEKEVLVFAGTDDRVHKANDYPRFADEMPNGRFFYFGIEENEREFAMGILMYEISKIHANVSIPQFFKQYEKEIKNIQQK
ncbi:MAG: hypothetical protein ACFFDW_14040 [Candidatus Thorarchaeota archaeon]